MHLLDAAPYALYRDEKQPALLGALNECHSHHMSHCTAYQRIVKAQWPQWATQALPQEIADLPFLSVNLFKEQELLSTDKSAVFKTLYSSGTTGVPSKIFLDAQTAALQSKTLVKIMQHWVGKERLPMLILDHPGVIQNRSTFSARGAGIQGLSFMGRHHCYALTDDMQLNLDAIDAFCAQYGSGPVLMFGFTFMVYQYVIKALQRAKRTLSLPHGILLHSGGWKKLQAEAVSNDVFKQQVSTTLGCTRIHNFYGMVEQVGAIFVECEHGHLHSSTYNDIIVRTPSSGWQTAAHGEEGLLQLVSCLPRSYPGNSLLTEDRGRILGEDDCPCGRAGKYFEVLGRLPKAEVRGCSDTFTPSHETSAITAPPRSLLAGSDTHDEADFWSALFEDPNIHWMTLPSKGVTPTLAPAFCEQTLNFCDALSNRLLSDPTCKNDTALVAFGFWLRKRAITSMLDPYKNGYLLHKPLGVVFHNTPANVDTLFAYSAVLSLLCGNINIVRISDRAGESAHLLAKILAVVSADYPDVGARLLLMQCPHAAVNTFLHMLDGRVLWGSNESIVAQRQLPVPAHCRDITMAHKVSYALIGADAVCALDDAGLKQLAERFARDNLTYAQQACSSAKGVFWLGDEGNVREAQARFWPEVAKLAEGKLTDSDAFTALTMGQAFSTHDETCELELNGHTCCFRACRLPFDVTVNHHGFGLFIEVAISSTNELSLSLGQSTQTLSQFGVSQSTLCVVSEGLLCGLDRVVPIGKALQFHPIWDGVDLISQLSRAIALPYLR